MWQTQTPTLTVMSLHTFSCTTEVKTELLKFNLPKFLTGKNLNVTGSELADGPWAAKEGAAARSHFKLYTMGTDQVKI